jgi:anaerobic dimethyl sulfoxide reductase subunit C (anchor subunit)
LGKPLFAYRAFYNIKSSWLSREILFLVAFFILSVVRLYSEWQGLQGAATLIGWLAMLAGCLCLLSMASAYTRTEFPAWGMFYTHVAFYMTAISLGGGLFSLIAVQKASAVSTSMIHEALALAAAAVLVQIIAFGAYLPALAVSGSAARASMRLLVGMNSPIFISLCLMVTGGFLLPVLVFTGTTTGEGKTWMYVSFIFLAVGQTMARYIFYASGVHRTPDGAAVFGGR